MFLAFSPSREGIRKEIQQWVAMRRVDMLLGLCNCCIYKQHEYTLSRDCRSCSVRAGIRALTHEQKQDAANGDELRGFADSPVN